MQVTTVCSRRVISSIACPVVSPYKIVCTAYRKNETVLVKIDTMHITMDGIGHMNDLLKDKLFNGDSFPFDDE